MTTPTTEPQRELLRGAYAQGALNNYERLANSATPPRKSSVTPAQKRSVIPALAAGISP